MSKAALPARPRDMNQLAKRSVEISVGDAEDELIEETEKTPMPSPSAGSAGYAAAKHAPSVSRRRGAARLPALQPPRAGINAR